MKAKTSRQPTCFAPRQRHEKKRFATELLLLKCATLFNHCATHWIYMLHVRIAALYVGPASVCVLFFRILACRQGYWVPQYNSWSKILVHENVAGFCNETAENTRVIIL